MCAPDIRRLSREVSPCFPDIHLLFGSTFILIELAYIPQGPLLHLLSFGFVAVTHSVGAGSWLRSIKDITLSPTTSCSGPAEETRKKTCSNNSKRIQKSYSECNPIENCGSLFATALLHSRVSKLYPPSVSQISFTQHSPNKIYKGGLRVLNLEGDRA